MQIQGLRPDNPLWQSVIQYAKRCSWKDGPMIAGYCTLAKTDCLPSLHVTPFIGFVFVGEAYRGHRLSEKLIRFALAYAQRLGFERVYLVSREEGLYEKYGFELLAKQTNELGQDDQIFKISTR